jgi:hypothetical protein
MYLGQDMGVNVWARCLVQDRGMWISAAFI